MSLWEVIRPIAKEPNTKTKRILPSFLKKSFSIPKSLELSIAPDRDVPLAFMGAAFSSLLALL